MFKTSDSQREKVNAERVNGGAGFITRERLLESEQLGDYCRMFNRITLLPGCEIGHHDHFGETETYYFLEGNGMYEEDGIAVEVTAGDVTFCDDGHGHGVKNSGNVPLVFVALILKK